MVGLGAANLAAGFFQGFAVSSSASRSPAAEAAGARTQLAGVVGAATVALLLIVAPDLLRINLSALVSKSSGAGGHPQPLVIRDQLRGQIAGRAFLELVLQLLDFLLVLLVGGGPEEDRLRAMVERMGIGRFVRFTGRVHHEEVPSYYALTDICVFPRRQIRLTDLVTPLKPLEAMASRKPIVASDVGGHRELITDAETGYLFAAGHAAALVKALAGVISDPVAAVRTAANARRHVETHLNWDIVVDKYGVIYDELLAKKQRN
jgi:hypothetical protein